MWRSHVIWDVSTTSNIFRTVEPNMGKRGWCYLKASNCSRRRCGCFKVMDAKKIYTQQTDRTLSALMPRKMRRGRGGIPDKHAFAATACYHFEVCSLRSGGVFRMWLQIGWCFCCCCRWLDEVLKVAHNQQIQQILTNKQNQARRQEVDEHETK